MTHAVAASLLVVCLTLGPGGPATVPTSHPASAPTSEPTTAPATRPALAPEQRSYLHAAQAFTAGRKIQIVADVTAARAEYNASKSAPIIAKLIDDKKIPIDEKRLISPAGKIVYQFRTVAKRKEVTDDLKLKLDRLELEKAALDSGKFRSPPLLLMNALKQGDAGDTSEQALALQVFSQSDYIVDFHSAIFCIEHAPADGEVAEKKMVQLPSRLAVTGTRDYLNRFGNAQMILVLTYVEPFKLEEHANE